MPSPPFLAPSPLTTPTPEAEAEPLQTPLQELGNGANTDSGHPHAGQKA
jgi:hypothetical protein